MDISELLGTIGKTEEQDKISYSAGVVFALSLKDMGFEEISYDDFSEGMRSVYENSYPKIPPKRAIDIFNNYVAILREEQIVKNEEEGKAFLEKNKEKSSVYMLPNGLQYEILEEGNGRVPLLEDRVEVEYEGSLIDTRVFDSTRDVGPQVFEIASMIEGWQDVLTMMPEGSRWKVYIPPYLAYGDIGNPPMIQPNATLVFIIELIRITH